MIPLGGRLESTPEAVGYVHQALPAMAPGTRPYYGSAVLTSALRWEIKLEWRKRRKRTLVERCRYPSKYV